MKLIITALFLLVTQLSFGQTNWINYTNTHRINDIIETDQGLWLGSEGGLCYYNSETGEEIYYNRGNSIIPSNRVTDLLYQSNNDLWLSTRRGLSKMSGGELVNVSDRHGGILRETLDEKLIIAASDSLFIQTDELEFKAIEYPDFIAEIGGIEVNQDNGAIYLFVNNWFAESYLAEWKDDVWTILYSEYIFDSSMTIDEDGKIWLINTTGLQYFDNGDWILASDLEALEQVSFPKLFVNNENQIVIFNRGEGTQLFVWDDAILKELNYWEDDWSGYNYFIKPSERDDDLYYSSNLTKGLYSFSSTEINEPQRLAQSPINSNFVTNTIHLSDGSHLIFQTGSIQYLQSGEWTDHSVPDDLYGTINKGFIDKDKNLWVKDISNLWTYQNDEWSIFELPADLQENLGLVEFGENGDIWIQSNLNLGRLRNGEWEIFQTIHHGITSSIFKDMKIDSLTGDLWVTTFQGVRHFDGQSWESFEPNSFNHTFGLAIGNDGVFYRENGGLNYIKDGVIDSIPMPDDGDYNPWASKMIYNPEQDELYMTGLSVLAAYRNEVWTTYSVIETGLYDSGTNDISVDLNQNIWLSGSGGGICIFNKEGITTLSVEDDPNAEDLSFINVYPTLLTQNSIFIESDVKGEYQILISDISGKKFYNQMHYLAEGIPNEIILPHTSFNLLLITIRSKDLTTTQKVFRVRS